MRADSLETFIAGVQAAWAPLSTELVDVCRRQMQALVGAPSTEPWLAALHRDASERRELYRDPHHCFMLLAHIEHQGQFRAPHDHGRSWVIYGVQRGAFEMRTYACAEQPSGEVKLVMRDSTIVRAGQVMVYLPGDIHDTRCLTEDALEFRFTERDLRLEEEKGHRVTRYVERGGIWTTP